MKYLIRTLKILLGLLLLLIVVFFLGPKVERPKVEKPYPKVTSDLAQLEQEIISGEASVGNMKADNEARIIWADSIPQKTPYSIVYLHGWSASQEEGDPVHIETAKRYGWESTGGCV